MNPPSKRLKLKEGCYVQNTECPHKVFECISVPKSASKRQCKIKDIFGGATRDKELKISSTKLIPQTLLYYHKDCEKHVPLCIEVPLDCVLEAPRRVKIPGLFLKDKSKLYDKCVVMKPKEATLEQLLLTHSQSHLDKVRDTERISMQYIQAQQQQQHNKDIEQDEDDDSDIDMVQDTPPPRIHAKASRPAMNTRKRSRERRENATAATRTKAEQKQIDEDTPRGPGFFNCDTYFNEHSYRAAKLAAGAVIGLVKNICNNRCGNGLALIRPPGHHCERNKVMGFCLLNNVAVAVNVARHKKLCSKVLIVDWDVHHGNGLQHIYYEDKDVLYFSVHRHDNGSFYPYTGRVDEDGNGFNVNVPLNALQGARYGDAAYLDIWRCVLIPIAMQFAPELIVISAGFDACIHDPINGNAMAVSPPCYGVLCRMLMNVCPKLAVVLEGGYQLASMTPAIGYVIWALLRGAIDDLYEFHVPWSGKYDAREMQEYVENTLWYKSIFFECEFRRFVLDTMDEDGYQYFVNECFQCHAKYDEEQQADLTKWKRRSVIKRVLKRHKKYWSNLTLLHTYFHSKY